METASLPLSREVVLIGGGHAHALVLRMWAMRPLAGARLTLVSPDPTAPYTGMLPGHVEGLYPRETLEIDLVRLCRIAGARLVLGRAEAIDRDRREVRVAGRGAQVAYDLLSLDIGATTEMPHLPGFAEHAVPAKPMGAFAERWAAFLAGSGPARITVIGAGAAGVELALAMRAALDRRGRAPEVQVVERASALPDIGARARARILARLGQAGVDVIEGRQVVAVEAGAVLLADGRRLASDLTVGTGGVRPQGWLASTGLPLTNGFVEVGPDLRSPADPSVFAAGDCAHLLAGPRPKAGVYAVRAAPVLFHNLRAALMGTPLREFRPQRDFLRLVATGGRTAVADKWGLSASGRLVWRWKDRIDRRFMDRFGAMAMLAPPLPAPRVAGAVDAEPLCGGCGAKVGADVLSRVVAGLAIPDRPDVVTPAGDDAAVLSVGGKFQALTTDHLRAFWPDPWLMARIAAVHALGDIWAMGAAPQAALAQVILPRLAPRLQEAWLAEIMAAAGEVLGAEGAAIVGGHTSMGAELSVGFSLTGLADRPVTLAGARPGDALILTKPLGTGVILAAEMRGEAPGKAVADCLALMARPQGEAARLLWGAHAMTDVTGFGLAGHLLALCRASGVAAEVDMDRVPLYPGAAMLAARGVRSTIHAANKSAAGALVFRDEGAADILFDPQTAGGLLAAVEATRADDLVAAIRATGLPAARIGRILAGPPTLTIL